MIGTCLGAALTNYAGASAQVLTSVSKRLAEMHQAGLVHLNLKPSNILWLSQERRWVLSGFANMARVGRAVPLRFTLAYAPPEVALSQQVQDREIVADAALDAWALGVIAVELFTGSPPFDLMALGPTRVRTPAAAWPCLANVMCSSTTGLHSLGCSSQPSHTNQLAVFVHANAMHFRWLFLDPVHTSDLQNLYQ